MPLKRWLLFGPVGLMVAYAGYLGVRIGQVPTETEIINRYAAAYLAAAPEDARATDCAATPHPDAVIRMVILCRHPVGLTTTYYVGPRGEALPKPEEPST